MIGTQMVMVGNVVAVLLKSFVPLQIPGQPITEMIQTGVVGDAECPGACISEVLYIKLKTITIITI